MGGSVRDASGATDFKDIMLGQIYGEGTGSAHPPPPEMTCSFPIQLYKICCIISLRGRRLKGKGKGVLGARETRGEKREGRNAKGARGGREGNACQETTVFAIPPTNYVFKNNATVND